MAGWGTGWNQQIEPALETLAVNDKSLQKQSWAEAVLDAFITDIPKFLNKHPTHDPYTNPNAHIYYQCGCGAILDPGTKSFAALNNCASDNGWKVRWGADSYVPYCVKCGEDVE